MLPAETNLVQNTYKSIFGNEYLELLKLFLAHGQVKTFAKSKALFKENEAQMTRTTRQGGLNGLRG